MARLQQFILGLFAGQQPEAGPARDLTVPMLLERGVLTADALDEEPDIRAELWLTIGTIFGQLGDIGRAETLITRSLDDRDRRLPPGDPRVAEALVTMSLLRTDQNQHAEGERLARDAIGRLAGVLRDSRPLAIKRSARRLRRGARIARLSRCSSQWCGPMTAATRRPSGPRP
jgi:hypothetical protein